MLQSQQAGERGAFSAGLALRTWSAEVSFGKN
jgi:hypothetical protein